MKSEVQYKGRHMFVCGKVLLEENHRAWLSQTKDGDIVEYNQQRSVSSRTRLLSEFAGLLCNLAQLPALGFNKLAGMENMPDELCADDCSLASDFVGLVVSHMSNTAWDFTFWAEEWPQAFAGFVQTGTEDGRFEDRLEVVKSQWRTIMTLEKFLFPKAPAEAAEVTSLLCDAARTTPELDSQQAN